MATNFVLFALCLENAAPQLPQIFPRTYICAASNDVCLMFDHFGFQIAGTQH